jgi:hypothetical protein
MNKRIAALLLGLTAASLTMCAADAPLQRPLAGKVEIMPASEVKPGMKAVAWTVFQGTEPEPVPVEIIGFSRNMWGPKQDIIIGKMGGKAARTNVAKGMSGSPVYINGKLVGAVSLGLSQFSPDAICGITPIELMLEINGADKSRPVDARVPGKAAAQIPQAGGDGAVRIADPDRFAAGLFGIERRYAARVRLRLPADGRTYGAGVGRQFHAWQQAGCGLGTCAESRR